MARLHFFFPENDLALALDKSNYTPPPAASRLRVSGATLPLWFGDDGDEFIADGVNARWLADMRGRFGMNIKPYSGWHDAMRPAPWGWSLASRRVLSLRGVPDSVLPSDSSLGAMRMLSHRRISAFIARRLGAVLPFSIAPPAEEIHAIGDIDGFLARYPQAVLKLPWSSSGRGLIVLRRDELDARRSSVEGAIRRQGMLMAEPRFEKKLDFALLFTMDGGRCRYVGISVFRTVQFGSYAGNILAPQSDLLAMASGACAPGHLQAVAEALPAVLEEIIGPAYDGPVGVDMMAVTNADYSIAPAVELNLRMTMGHVCLRLYERYITDGCHGSFYISSTPVRFDAIVRNSRLVAGSLPLSQPGTSFTFLCQV